MEKQTPIVSIGLFETGFHFGYLHAIGRIASAGGARVTLFCTELLHKEVRAMHGNRCSEYTWVVQAAGESMWSYMRRVREYCDRHIQLLIVTTCSSTLPNRQFLYYMFQPACKTVLVAARVEDWFGEWIPVQWRSVKGFVLWTLRVVSQRIRRRELRQFDGLIVETLSAAKYAVERGYGSPILQLAATVFEGTLIGTRQDARIRFVVPGGLVDYRRDYDGLLDAFEKLFVAGRTNMKLSLLGSPQDHRAKGLEILARCRKLRQRGLDIDSYNEHIPEDTFAREIAIADFIIDPLRPGFHGTGSSGAVMRAVQYGKPAIYPANSLRHEELASSSLFYETIEDLVRILERAITDVELRTMLSQRAIVNSMQFSLGAVSGRFASFVREILLQQVS